MADMRAPSSFGSTNCRAFCSDESRMLKPLSFGDMGAEIRGVI